MSSVTTWIVEANEGKATSKDQAEKNIHKLKQSFYDDTDTHDKPIYGLCEIDEGDKYNNHAILKDTWPNYGWAHFDEMVPIGFPVEGSGDWELVWQKKVPTHPGLEKVTPHRPIIEAKLRRKNQPWCEIVAINSHAVAGPFTHPDQSHERDRRDYWFWWWGVLRERVRTHVANGEAWIFTGDTNRPDMPKIHDDQKTWVAASLDYVVGGDGDHVRFEKKKTRTIDLTIDGHNAHAVLLEMHQA